MHKTTYVDFFWIEEQVIQYAYESREWYGEQGGIHSSEFTLVKKNLVMSVELSVIDEFIKMEVMGDWLSNSPHWNKELIVNRRLLENLSGSVIHLSGSGEIGRAPKWINDLDEPEKDQIRYCLKWITANFSSSKALDIQYRDVFTKNAIS